MSPITNLLRTWITLL